MIINHLVLLHQPSAVLERIGTAFIAKLPLDPNDNTIKVQNFIQILGDAPSAGTYLPIEGLGIGTQSSATGKEIQSFRPPQSHHCRRRTCPKEARAPCRRKKQEIRRRNRSGSCHQKRSGCGGSNRPVRCRMEPHPHSATRSVGSSWCHHHFKFQRKREREIGKVASEEEWVLGFIIYELLRHLHSLL